MQQNLYCLRNVCKYSGQCFLQKLFIWDITVGAPRGVCLPAHTTDDLQPGMKTDSINAHGRLSAFMIVIRITQTLNI